MKTVPLGDLCHIRIGRTPSRANPDYWGGPHPWATISDMGDSPLTRTREGVTDLAVREARLQPVAPGTLLYSFKLTIGKMAVVATEIYTNEAIAALVPRNPFELDSKYLRFALATIDGGEYASTAVKGRTLNSETLGMLPVPIVRIEEQQRIAIELAATLDSVRHARTASDERARHARVLRTSIIERGLGTKATRGWQRPVLASVLRSPLRTGVSAPEVQVGGMPGLSLAAVRNGVLDLTATKRVDVDESTNRLVREGCFYVVRGNGRLEPRRTRGASTMSFNGDCVS